MGRPCFGSGSKASPLFSAIAARPRNIFLCLPRRLKSGVEFFCSAFFPSNPEPVRQPSPCREQLQKSRENAGGGVSRGFEGARTAPAAAPPAREAGPRGAGPISAHRLSPGLLPLVPGSSGAQSGAESLAQRLHAVGAASSPLSLQQWGSLGGLSRPSSSTSSSYFRYPIASPLPCRMLPGGRAGSACGGVGEGVGVAGLLEATASWEAPKPR